MKFYDNLAMFSDKTAIINTKGETLTYSDLVNESDNLAKNYSKEQKNLVFIFCRNNAETIIGYLSALKSNSVAFLIDNKTDNKLMQVLIDTYKPEFIWKPLDNDCNVVYSYKEYGLIRMNSERKIKIDENLKLLLSTSGSTGSPKLVKLTGDNLDSNAKSIAEYLKLTSDERPVTSLPFHYTYGLSVINSHFSTGSTILLTDGSMVMGDFWDFFKFYQGTSFAGVPYMYEILKRLKFFNMKLPSLKTMTQAGGKLHPDLALEFSEFSHKNNINFFIMYGQTEATARISYVPPEKNIEKFKSIGIAIPGGELTIIDEHGNNILEPGINGELVYKGSNVMMGYATCEYDLSKGDELKGILKTGDIAYFDEDKYFYITGRKKRFLKIFGNRVNLDEIELFLKSEGYECACGGRDDLLCIAIINQKDGDLIKNKIVKTYNFNSSVLKILQVEKITRSESGKILYDEMFKGIQ